MKFKAWRMTTDEYKPNVVDVERCLQAHHQPGPVELDGQDGVGVAVVADLGALLEVADLEQLLGQRLKNDALNLF